MPYHRQHWQCHHHHWHWELRGREFHEICRKYQEEAFGLQKICRPTDGRSQNKKGKAAEVEGGDPCKPQEDRDIAMAALALALEKGEKVRADKEKQMKEEAAVEAVLRLLQII